MTYAELVDLCNNIDRLMVEKQNSELTALREKLTSMAKDHGLSIEDLFGKNGRRGSVAVKYRHPRNPLNTWTGRGRMARWLVAALKGGKAKKEAFLV